MALGLDSTLRNNMLDEITALAGTSALLRIYDGTQPATGGTATTLLAQLTCNASQFALAASANALTLSAITQDSSANAGGTATWFRIVQSDGTTHVLDGTVTSVATGTGDLQLDNAVITLGGTVAVNTAVITAGNP